jgi:hypothetical protein
MENPFVVLSEPDPAARLTALTRLATVSAPTPTTGACGNNLRINLHAHTIYSYNGYDYSPSSLAWLARTEGWYALGTVDFDVLDGVDESLAACEICSVRGAAGFETRVYLPDRPDEVFNSPGEPGVMYYVGMGFAHGKPSGIAGPVMEGLRTRAQARNREMIARINAYLAPVSVDYDADVLPLTPGGNATERHMLIAYDAAARRQYPARGDLLAFWANKLGTSVSKVDAFLGDTPFPHDAIRARLMKQGGPGYMAPGPHSFPPLDAVIAATLACGALPCYPFVDGTSAGERDMAELLSDFTGRGIVGMVLVPDRNWNVAGEDRSRDLVDRLHVTLDAADELDVPVFIGTEMNKPGQLLIDDLRVPSLAEYAGQFRRGADLLFAHTALARWHGLGFQSDWAQEYLPSRCERVRFYTALGRLLSPRDGSIATAAALLRTAGPQAALDALSLS